MFLLQVMSEENQLPETQKEHPNGLKLEGEVFHSHEEEEN